MRQCRLLFTSILLGTLAVGPVVSCVVQMPREIVTLKMMAGSVTFDMLLARLQSLAIAGMFTGLVSGVVCAKVQGERPRAALWSTRILLTLSGLPSLVLHLLAWRSLTPSILLSLALSLALLGVAAALTGYLTACFAGWWEEQREPPEPPQLSTSRPRPTRYRI